MIAAALLLRPTPSHTSLFVRAQCSRGCTGHALYGTATGTRWCFLCYQRYLLVEMVQVCFLAHLTDSVSMARSPLSDWLHFACTGQPQDIANAVAAMEGVA